MSEPFKDMKLVANKATSIVNDTVDFNTNLMNISLNNFNEMMPDSMFSEFIDTTKNCIETVSNTIKENLHETKTTFFNFFGNSK